MSRTLAGLDRVMVALAGLVLVVGGVAGIVWQLKLWDRASGTVSARWLPTAAQQWWWPWAVAAIGVVLIVVALRWLAAHFSRSKITSTRLPGSDSSGRLTVDLTALAAAAAASLTDTPGVRSTAGKAVDERGLRTITLTVTVDPSADLPTVTSAAERVCAELATVLPDRSLATRVHLRTARGSTATRSIA